MDCRDFDQRRRASLFAQAMTTGSKETINRALICPGEGDLVERLRPEPFRGAPHHPPDKRAIEFGGTIVVGERPDHHALQTALHEVTLGRREQAAAEAQPLELRT